MIFIFAVLAAFTLGAVTAQIAKTYIYPNIGVITTTQLALYIDNVYCPNNTAIDWEVCEPGYSYEFTNMTILNNGSLTVTAYITTYGLPSDWGLTWNGNNTQLTSQQSVEAPLVLSIPDTAMSWPTWGFQLHVAQP